MSSLQYVRLISMSNFAKEKIMNKQKRCRFEFNAQQKKQQTTWNFPIDEPPQLSQQYIFEMLHTKNVQNFQHSMCVCDKWCYDNGVKCSNLKQNEEKIKINM